MNMLIREEKGSDIEAIRMVHELAFDSADEASLVDLLRSSGKAVISLVAEENGKLLGHILFSPVSIDPRAPGWNALGLAPVAVIPGRQRQGIGKALVSEGIEHCRSVGCSVIAVLGDPGYYTQFGFTRATDFGLGNEYQANDEFMVIELSPDVLDNFTGMVTYAPEFGKIGV